MLVIIFSASTFLKIIPQLATSIAGNPNFTSILGGTELGKGKVAELLGGRTGENLVDTFHKRSLLNVTKTP
jgi:hypothetical protein